MNTMRDGFGTLLMTLGMLGIKKAVEAGKEDTARGRYNTWLNDRTAAEPVEFGPEAGGGMVTPLSVTLPTRQTVVGTQDMADLYALLGNDPYGAHYLKSGELQFGASQERQQQAAAEEKARVAAAEKSRADAEKARLANVKNALNYLKVMETAGYVPRDETLPLIRDAVYGKGEIPYGIPTVGDVAIAPGEGEGTLPTRATVPLADTAIFRKMEPKERLAAILSSIGGGGPLMGLWTDEEGAQEMRPIAGSEGYTKTMPKQPKAPGDGSGGGGLTDAQKKAVVKTQMSMQSIGEQLNEIHQEYKYLSQYSNEPQYDDNGNPIPRSSEREKRKRELDTQRKKLEREYRAAEAEVNLLRSEGDASKADAAIRKAGGQGTKNQPVRF